MRLLEVQNKMYVKKMIKNDDFIEKSNYFELDR